MKQLLFLLLFPCLAMAQYQGNAGQKITLGEQTSADGLVYRGVANDTNFITPFSDTSAYIILDTVNNKFFHYKRNTNVWSVAGGSDTTSIAYVNTYGTQTVNGAKTFTSAVTSTRFNPTANTATGTGMYLPAANTLGFSTNGSMRMTISPTAIGVRVTPSTLWDLSVNPLEFSQGSGLFSNVDLPIINVFTNYIGTSSGAQRLVNGRSSRFIVNAFNDIDFDFVFYSAVNGNAGTSITWIEKLKLLKTGFFGIGDNITPTQKLDVDGNARIRSVGAGAFGDDLNITSDGTLTTETSDEKYKYNILPINYGLNTILQLKPVNFQWIKGEEKDLGFIAQDVAEIIPEAVNTNWNSDLLMRYNSIIPILTKAIQEQQALIKALEQRILNLENK